MGFVWHNNENVGFKVTDLKVWGLICHKEGIHDRVF